MITECYDDNTGILTIPPMRVCPRSGNYCTCGQEWAAEKMERQLNYNLGLGWQLCPKCNGEGSCDSYRVLPCDVCNGKKIISIQTGLPPL